MPPLDKATTIVFVGHGLEPIPPTGWGAVEHVIWEYTKRLRELGYTVEIINAPKRQAVKQVWNLAHSNLDLVVHCHAEKPIQPLNLLRRLRPFTLVSTLHVPIAFPLTKKYERKALRRILPAPNHLVLIPSVRDIIASKNKQAKAIVFKNAVETELYQWSPQTNGKAVCIGRIQARKRQNELAHALQNSEVDCDFVGPDRGEVEVSPALKQNMIGEWDKPTLYARLQEYGCLVLYSVSEGQPLVVMEALAAGLPIVVSQAAAEGLDLTKPFIHVVKSEHELIPAIKNALTQKATLAPQIRAYAEEEFSYTRRVEQYLDILNHWHQKRR